MTSEQVFNPGLWYLWLVLTALSMPLFIFVLWRSWKFAIVFLVLVFSLVVYLAFFSVHNFGGAFGAGMALSCISALLVPISLIIWILLRRPFRRVFGDDLMRRRLFVIGGIIIISLQLFPFAGSYVIDSFCYRMSRSNAEALIDSMEAYHHENSNYPPDVESLYPNYLSAIPVPGCGWLRAEEYSIQARYEIYTCRDGEVLLTNESADGTSIERYNFSTGQWSSISFFDGACSYLR